MRLRLTDARGKEAQVLVLQAPGRDDHPAIDLVRMVAKFRAAAPLACTYLRQIPLTAKSMYADPYRRVLWVWNKGDDLRIAVADAAGPADEPPAEGDEHWLAYREGQWEASGAPGGAGEAGTEPEAATQGAAAVATATATQTEAATQVGVTPGKPGARYDYPGLIPQEEAWWTQPNVNATTVYHYVPLSANNGITRGFVVPSFIFDDDHFAVDLGHGILYLIHDGQLFSLVIPPAALQPR
jgi:hypothetical protein